MAEVNTGYSSAQTYVNGQGLKLENLVYVAGSDGKNTVASDEALGVKPNDNDVFVKTQDAQTGIYHPNMLKQWKAQYSPQESTSNSAVDEARQNLDFSKYVTNQFESKADEVFGLLKNQTPEQRAEFKKVHDQISADLDKKGLTPEEKKEQLNLLSFKALADLNKGTDIGNKSMEAYALGNYSKGVFDATRSMYGMPLPGENNPYNQNGQTYYDYANQVQDPAIQEKIKQQQTLQFLNLVTLLMGGGMGNFAMLFGPWMMR